MNKDELQSACLKLRKELFDDTIKPIKELLQLYKNALKNIEMEVDYITKKFVVDDKLSISYVHRARVLESLKSQINKQVDELTKANLEITERTLNDVCTNSYYQTAYLIESGINVKTDFSILHPNMVKSIVYYPIEDLTFDTRIWNNQKKLKLRLYTDIQKAVMNGTSTEKLSKSIVKDFGVSAHDAARLINTEVSRVVATAQDKIYNDSDVIEQVMWCATLENNTCSECGDLDGTIKPKDNHPNIPVHPLCRCCVIPVIDGWNPKTRIDNETKKKIDYMSYNDWYKMKYGNK